MIQKLKNLVHLALAVLANFYFGFPSRKLTVIGVTGTDGKTTTSSLIYHILNSTGHKTAMITTVGAYMDARMVPIGLHVTTPSSWTLQKFLRQAADSGHKFAVVETSSHGIDQNRVWGIKYRVAALTNITHEHLDYHGTYQSYLATKVKLLRRARAAVINADDPSFVQVRSLLSAQPLTYSLEKAADFTPQKYPFKSRLFGSFNLSNSLAAIGVCKVLGLPDADIQMGMESFEAPPGRQQIVATKPFTAMVDFAHTPNAIENVLREVKKVSRQRLIHLFGAPGRRDETKRPLMGLASSRYADAIIVTADDPRDESVDDIAASILSGIDPAFARIAPEQALNAAGKFVVQVNDRMEAIRLAVRIAKAGDYLVCTGKGHEQSLAYANEERPWDEPTAIAEALKELNKPA